MSKKWNRASFYIMVKTMEKTRYNSINIDQRRLQIEDALSVYPHLTSYELGDLIDWFKHEATAFEVAILASNSAIYDNYRCFRREHIDRLTVREIVGVIGVATLIVVATAALAVSV